MTQAITTPARLHDFHPAIADFRVEILSGLRQAPKCLHPKHFYDAEGSRLFDAICTTPEYYLTRTEHALLQAHAQDIATLAGPGCLLIEPGCGSCQKVRLLLDTLCPSTYLPMDISRQHLWLAAQALAAEYPQLPVHAVCLDHTQEIRLPSGLPECHRLIFYPGSSIGNFHPWEAQHFLRRLADVAGPGGGLVIGVDTRKDAGILHAAYNDTQGYTAAFNLNLLQRINRELDADFSLAAFRHEAFYNERLGRVEMHLASCRAQRVRIGNEWISFCRDEAIHTENSYKYEIGEFQMLAAAAGFRAVQAWTDARRLFSLHYFTVA